MGIKYTLKDSGTGVPMTFHLINFVNIQIPNNSVIAVVSCYYDEDAYTSGLRPLHQDQIAVEGLPDQGADYFDWLQAKLVEPVDATLNLAQYPNRWMLSGGVIADRTPYPATTASQTASEGTSNTEAAATTGDAVSGASGASDGASGTSDAATGDAASQTGTETPAS